MFMADVAGVRVLYTGDYSCEEDRHLRVAEIPQFSPDICIIESTYGVQLHQPRNVREKRFTDVIHSTISQGGCVLILTRDLWMVQGILRLPWALISQVAFISYFFFWFHIVSKTFAFISQYSSSVIWIQVYGYRMSLWAEHLGVIEDCFCQPETLECMRKVNNIAKTYWQTYAAKEYKEMTQHLMQYPIQVNKDGKVTTLPGHECFPDVSGKVLGSSTNLLDALIT